MRSVLLLSLLALQPMLAAAQGGPNPKPPQPADHGHAIVAQPERIEWKPAPPSLPAGAQVALLEGDPSKAGPFTMRLRLPDGYRIPLHHHPGQERVTVISGTFVVGMGEQFDASNGVLNLVLDKQRAVAEIFRVLRPGGHVQIADIVLGTSSPDSCRSNPRLRAECVVGATREEEYLELFRHAGFVEVEQLRGFDYFAGSDSDETRRVAASFAAHSVELRATKPG